MPLALVVGDKGKHPGDVVISGSSRTIVAGCQMAHVGSSLATHSEGSSTHSGESIADHNATGRTYVFGSKESAASGAPTTCGDAISASHTTRTYIGG